MINWWCIVAIIALVIGGICSLITKKDTYFGDAIFLTLFIGLGYILMNG